MGENQGWLQPTCFMGMLVFSESISAFLGTKKVLLVMSIQLQVKSKYYDYILVRAESSLIPAFPRQPFHGCSRGRGGSCVSPVPCDTNVPLCRS